MISVKDLQTAYGNEMALVVLLCRVHFKTESKESIQTFLQQQEVNWDSFVKICRKNSIRPIVYKTILAFDIPEKQKQFLKKELLALMSKSWNQAKELERIIQLLNDSGINAIPYKGPILSLQLFGELVSRESSDIDIVINPKDLTLVNEILKKDGYLPVFEDVKNILKEHFPKRSKDYSLDKYERTRRLYHLELHWQILENKIEMKGTINHLWQLTCEEEVVLNKYRYCFSKVDHAIAMFCHHLFQDAFCSLKYFLDVSGAIDNFNKNNLSENFRSKLIQNNLFIPFVFISDVCEHLFGIGQDQSLSHQYTSKVNKYLKLLLNGKRLNPYYKYNVSLLNYQLQFYKNCSLSDYFIKSLIKTFYTPEFTDILFFKIPSNLYFLYYPLKPIRIIIRSMQSITVSPSKKKMVQN